MNFENLFKSAIVLFFAGLATSQFNSLISGSLLLLGAFCGLGAAVQSEREIKRG